MVATLIHRGRCGVIAGCGNENRYVWMKLRSDEEIGIVVEAG